MDKNNIIDLANLKRKAAIVKAFKWYVSDDGRDMYSLLFHTACRLGVDHRDLAVENGTDTHDVVGAGYIYFDKVKNCVLLMAGSKEFGVLPARAWYHDINSFDINNTLKELIPLWNEKSGDNLNVETNFNYADVYFTNYSPDEIIEIGNVPSCGSVCMLEDY